MNRCNLLLSPLAPVWRRGLIATTLLLLAATSAHAQQAVRPFPAAAQRGVMQITYPPEMLLNGQTARLSPGARIRGTNNLLVLSGSLAGQSLLVNYVRDPQGMIHEVWLLNNTEAQQPMAGAPALSNYVSNAALAAGESGTATTGSQAQPSQP